MAQPAKSRVTLDTSAVPQDPVAAVAMTAEQLAAVGKTPTPAAPAPAPAAPPPPSGPTLPILRVLEAKMLFVSGRATTLRPGAIIDPKHYTLAEYQTIAQAVKSEPV
jgi:hypothetical protein